MSDSKGAANLKTELKRMLEINLEHYDSGEFGDDHYDMIEITSSAILAILAQEVNKAQVEARIAELWNPGLRIPENETVIRERAAQLNEELNQLTDRKAGLV